jgi:protoheme IX farnesyltransferase
MTLKNIIPTLLELAKVKITIAVSFTTITGYILASGGIDVGVLMPTLGIFLLACGSSAINHFQEREKDAKMKRTQDRPIPSGRISANGALLFAFILTAAGSFILYEFSGILAMQLGLLALIWYNVIYTPLKRKTAFAVVPGSVIGAIPPLVGWVAGGGEIADPRAMIMAFFFFIWQVPHFWLLMLKYGKEYSEAGFPSITMIYSDRQIKNITFIWIFATAVAALMLPMFHVVDSRIVLAGVVLSSVWLIYIFAGLLRSSEKKFNPFFYFMRINYFVLSMMILLSLDSFVAI